MNALKPLAILTHKALFFFIILGIGMSFDTFAQNDTIYFDKPINEEFFTENFSVSFFKNDHESFDDLLKNGHFEKYDWLRRGEYTNHSMWIRIIIKNNSTKDSIKKNLHFGKQKITEYHSQENNEKFIHHELKPNKLLIDYSYKDFFVPIALAANSFSTYWVKIEKDIFLEELFCSFYVVDENIEKKSGFDFIRIKQFAFICMIIGLFFFTGFIATLQAIFTKDKTYYFWAMYLFINALFFSAELNRSFSLGFLNIQTYNKSNSPIPWPTAIQFLVSVFYLTFISSFLEIKVQSKNIYTLTKVSISVMLLGFLYALYAVIVYDNNNTYNADILLILTNVLILVIIISIIRSKIPQKNLLMVGSLGVLFAATISVIIELMEIPGGINFWLIPIVCYGLGSVWELACFSLALSQRSRLIKLESQQLQKDYTAKLENELSIRLEVIHAKDKLLEEQRINTITTEFEQKISETEIAALRSQMNPHFIFNCLNSIKLYSLENDSESASEYLTKFSKLIRLVLDNSRSERLTLEKELETLRLYIEMEIMRFKEKVAYEMVISPDIDVQYVEIPPLLIQPFVENAIWHGLMHKDKGGKVSILVNLLEENMLEIQIIDNGVGREKSIEYKSKTATKHKSFGLKLTDERIGLINHLYKTKAKVEIIDLYDEKQIGCGTKVIIQIPI